MCKHFNKESKESLYEYLEEKRLQEYFLDKKRDVEIERKEKIDRKFTRESS